jgi:ubiquinone/menaquinone biosynthesis C-methylase UbiE
MPTRKLDIGCGKFRLDGFETLDIKPYPHVDYVCDASGPLPFEDGTFDYVYSCHTLEHIPWFKTKKVLTEWIRIVKQGGTIDISVPNFIELAEFIQKIELGMDMEMVWPYSMHEKKAQARAVIKRCPYLKASRIIFNGTPPQDVLSNYHKALFTPKYLYGLMQDCGIVNIHRESKQKKHQRATNLRMVGNKP